MSKRYGRNQKRRARERIAQLEADRAGLESIVLMMRSRERRSASNADNRVLMHDLTKIAIERIAAEVGCMVGDHIKRAVEGQIEARVSVDDAILDRAYRLRVSVPATDYNMMVPVQEYELWWPSEPRRGYYPD